MSDRFPGEYAAITQNVKDSLSRYIDHHCPTGHCLRAILSNDLCSAVSGADEETLAALPVIVMWLINKAPRACWGSAERYDVWIRDRT